MALTLIAIAAIAAPVLALTVLQTRSAHLETLEPDPMPILVEAIEETTARQTPALLELVWDEPVTLLAPTWAGVITRVDVEPGDLVTNGDPLARVDGIERRALATEAPFYRSLGAGSTGRDVSDLQRALADLGLYEGEFDGVYGGTLADGIREFARQIGAGPVAAFDPAWVVWLPSAPFDVGGVDLRVGAPAPVEGAPILRAPPRLRAASLVDTAGAEISLDPTDGWVFVNDAWQVDWPAAPATLEDELDGGEESVQGRLELADAMVSLAVPASGVVATNTGDLCVWVADGGAYRSVTVAVTGGRPGVAHVEGELRAGQPVLANPQAILETPGCS